MRAKRRRCPWWGRMRRGPAPTELSTQTNWKPPPRMRWRRPRKPRTPLKTSASAEVSVRLGLNISFPPGYWRLHAGRGVKANAHVLNLLYWLSCSHTNMHEELHWLFLLQVTQRDSVQHIKWLSCIDKTYMCMWMWIQCKQINDVGRPAALVS